MVKDPVVSIKPKSQAGKKVKKTNYPKKAELTVKWWEAWLKKTPSAMRKELTSLNAGKKIAEFEVAKDLLDKKRMEKALKEVNRPLNTDAVNIVLRHQDDDAFALLKQLYKIYVKEKELVTKLTDLKKDPPVKQKVKANVVIWRRDFVEEVKKVYKPKLVKFSGYKVALELNGDILDLLEKEKDKKTPAHMVEDAQKVCDAFAKKVAKRLASLEKEFAKSKGDNKKQIEAVETLINDDFRKLQFTLKTVPEMRWKKFQKRRTQYRMYKLKSSCKLTMGALGLVASGVGISGTVAEMVILPATAVAAIPGLVLSIVSGLKTLSKIAQDIRSLAISVETVQKRLNKNVNNLEKIYFEEKKKIIMLREVGTTILNTLLTIPIINSIPECEKDYKLWDNKVAGLTVEARKLSIEFEKLWIKYEKLLKQMKGIKGKKAMNVLGNVKKLRVCLTKAFNAAHGVSKRVNETEEAMSKIEPLLKKLSEKNSKFAKYFDTLFPIGVDALSACVSFGVGVPDVDSVIKGMNLGLSLIGELEETLLGELVEAV